MQSVIDVAQTFRQNEIFLTGANGFVGKIILGLLLDRYPDFKHLHVLIRPRPNLNAQERFENEVLGSPALEQVVAGYPKQALSSKISVWSGDASLPNAGLSEAEADALNGRAGLILNCAGLVEFFPPLEDSLRANVDSVERLAAFAKRLGAKLLHVSTCYVAGATDGLIEETEPILGFYPQRKGPSDHTFDHGAELAGCRERVRQIRQASKNDGQGGPQAIAARLTELGKQRAQRWGWVNTYTYTKSLGEQVLASQQGLDYAIVRPAIVESALKFPFPGWVEGGRTAAPLVLMAMGGLKDWPVRREIPLEVVPVDLVAGAILVAGALLLNGEQRQVYQLATADTNPLGLAWLVELLDDEARRASKNGGPRSPWWLDPLGRVRFHSEEGARRRRSKLQRRVERALRIAEKLERLVDRTGLPGKRKFQAARASLRTLGLQLGFREQTLDQYLPFILHHRYVFESQNIREAMNRISGEDRARLPWNPEQIDWNTYWRQNQIQGIKRWVEHEAVRQWAFKI
jgi:long-chain acyl-CoA synthetase